MSVLTASVLFAGKKYREGKNNCYFCGAPCDEEYHTCDYVKSTFTNYDSVKSPGSQYVCTGCVESLGWGDDEMNMIDGTKKHRTSYKGMAPRMYSWVLTNNKRLAFTKAHISIIRDILLNNRPKPPFSIILSDSGQKHLIFRAPVAMSDDVFPVMLEEEMIVVHPPLLKERLAMALPVVAATGKPALLEETTISTYITYEKYHDNVTGLENWDKVRTEPISRLAAWVSISKEDAQNECPNIRR